MSKSTPHIYYWKVSLRKFLFVVACIVYSMSCGQNIEVEWEKTFSGSRDERDANIIQTKDKGFLLVYNGSSDDDTIEMNNQDKDILVFKSNVLGEIQWKRSLGGSQNDYFKSVIETNQGYLIVGQSESDDGDLNKNEGESDA